MDVAQVLIAIVGFRGRGDDLLSHAVSAYASGTLPAVSSPVRLLVSESCRAGGVVPCAVGTDCPICLACTVTKPAELSFHSCPLHSHQSHSIRPFVERCA